MTAATLHDVVASLDAVSLEATNDAAALQTRVDRKYVIDAEVLAGVIDVCGSRLSVLAIDGLRRFGYESTYFDTTALDLFRATALERPQRIKVRTRTYLDAGVHMLEVKTRNSRGVTVKERLALAEIGGWQLTGDAGAFVDEHAVLPGGSRGLVPVLTTRYQRSTLVDGSDGARVTIDETLRCIGVDGRVLALRDDDVVLETKTSGRPSTIDRALWRAGRRPVSISKFGVGLAGLDPTLPSARWRRTMRRHFDLVA
jgi:hypothetical protein